MTLDGHVPSRRALWLLRREHPCWRNVDVSHQLLAEAGQASRLSDPQMRHNRSRRDRANCRIRLSRIDRALPI
jgi:hypothetical protein